LFFNCVTGWVSEADSSGKITSALILFTTSMSCNWLACSGVLPAVLMMIFSVGLAASSSFLAWLAHQTMPPVKPWVAVGMATPSVTFSRAEAGRRAGAGSQQAGAGYVSLRSFYFPLSRKSEIRRRISGGRAACRPRR
jgi:hypothetical protein